MNENVGDIVKVSLGIVTYNSANEISILMDSIKKNKYFSKLVVYVLDNASCDNTVKIIQAKYPWVHLIESKENLGFGKGHNVIIKKTNAKYHFIVNPDICINEDTIELGIKYLENNPEISVMTPLVRNIDGTIQYLPKKNPSFKYMIGGMFEKYSKTCKKWRDEYTLKNEKIVAPMDIEFCSGCFMMCRTDALKKIGGFDERYFLHFEDADLTRELRNVGRAIFNPNIEVTHKWERDNKKINKSFFVALKSMIIYMKKWR